jgi:hypothetical protein
MNKENLEASGLVCGISNGKSQIAKVKSDVKKSIHGSRNLTTNGFQ